MENGGKVNVVLEVPFPSERLAQIAYDVLRVDAEPKRSGVTKKLTIKDNILLANFSGEFARQLRVAVNSFFESLNLITQTLDFLGPPVSAKYSHF